MFPKLNTLFKVYIHKIFPEIQIHFHSIQFPFLWLKTSGRNKDIVTIVGRPLQNYCYNFNYIFPKTICKCLAGKSGILKFVFCLNFRDLKIENFLLDENNNIKIIGTCTTIFEVCFLVFLCVCSFRYCSNTILDEWARDYSVNIFELLELIQVMKYT